MAEPPRPANASLLNLRTLAASLLCAVCLISAPGGTAQEPLQATSTPFGTTASWTAENNQIGSWLGYVVGPAGDVNGDGLADVLITANQYSSPESHEGVALVWHGAASGPGAVMNWKVQSDQAEAFMGTSAGAAGDVNGDGYDDVIVGVHRWDSDEADSGKVQVYHGSPAGLSAVPDWELAGSRPNQWFGRVVRGIGDVNGDGYDDILVGGEWRDQSGNDGPGKAWIFYGSPSGVALSPAWERAGLQVGEQYGVGSSAGDINGDGYGDVIFGVPFYGNGHYLEGRVEVFYGSASGLAATPSWTREGNSTQVYLGSSVATAGDVNGDGYDDVMFGSSGFSNPQGFEGRVYAYYGSPAGLGASPSWFTESNHAGAYLGGTPGAIASAGDVNGDGYGDIILGAPQYSAPEQYEGRVFVHLGSPLGLNAIPAWWGEGNQSAVYFGGAAAGAGDVNGDGYDDVVVGAYHFSNIESDEGRAFLFLAAPPSAPPSGRVPDGGSIPGQPLTLALDAGGMLSLSWGPSCSTNDIDYEVYEGTLGDFASHTARLCTTRGFTSTTLLPAPGDRYYLIVPTNQVWQGSYGLRSDGSERPGAALACRPQVVDDICQP